MEGLGERVKTLRRQGRITQAELAEKIFVSESYIALIESGKRNPSSEIVMKLSGFFGVSADYLLNGDYSGDDSQRVGEWRSLTRHRTPQEIDSALKLVRTFFDSIDNVK